MSVDPTGGALVVRIDDLFARHGHLPYAGARREAVCALEHALQCAQLAESARADAQLVAAAFLHDVGHLLAADAIARNDRVDDRHEAVAVPFLKQGFGAAVVEPVRLHVEAKRFLVRVDPHYARSLSLASQHSLRLQGGPMRDDEIARFESLPFARDAVRLRRWDDLAKQPGCKAPPVGYFLALLEAVCERPHADAKTGVDAFDLR